MMLTKEECNEALEHIKTLRGSNYGWYYSGFNNSALPFDEDTNVISKLIKEHFDNPPLTHEEIEEGKWYWHNKLKYWMKIINKDVCTEIFPVMENEDGYIYFEEDTYFRKEVQE